jgi:CRP-like cAMP-binding protein
LLGLVADPDALIQKVSALVAPPPGATPAAGTAVPLLGDVGREAYLSLIGAMAHRRVPEGSEIVRQGDPGSSLFMLVGGEVSVRRTVNDKDSMVARMGAGSLFGEMALITAQPRSATVTTVQASELFEIAREHVEAVAAQHPAFTDELVQFARKRMLRNVLASSPVFKPFKTQERFEILKKFSSRIVAPGTEIIKEGAEGKALYLVASGEVQITKADKDGPVVLAHLHEGEVFGEIALIKESKTTATAVATQKTVLLSLDREKFESFADFHPEAKAYLSGLTEERLSEIDAAMASQMLDADELILI